MANKIVFRNVTKVFSGAVLFEALKSISFEVASSGVAALYGPSGSGKSSILNLASGLDRPTKGEVLIGDQLISDLSGHDLTLFRRFHVGFIFQNYNLFPSLTALENVEMIDLLRGTPEETARAQAIVALEQVGLGDRLNNRPGELSGGQQQRVAVARAIASKPSVLFADEPTANLDSTTAKMLIDLFFALNEKMGTTVLFSTHDKSIISRVPQLIEVKDGELI